MKQYHTQTHTQKETILGGYHNIVANGVKTFWKEKFALFSSVITRHQLQTHILLKVCRMRGIVTAECIMNKLMLQMSRFNNLFQLRLVLKLVLIDCRSQRAFSEHSPHRIKYNLNKNKQELFPECVHQFAGRRSCLFLQRISTSPNNSFFNKANASSLLPLKGDNPLPSQLVL